MKQTAGSNLVIKSCLIVLSISSGLVSAQGTTSAANRWNKEFCKMGIDLAKRDYQKVSDTVGLELVKVDAQNEDEKAVNKILKQGEKVLKEAVITPPTPEQVASLRYLVSMHAYRNESEILTNLVGSTLFKNFMVRHCKTPGDAKLSDETPLADHCADLNAVAVDTQSFVNQGQLQRHLMKQNNVPGRMWKTVEITMGYWKTPFQQRAVDAQTRIAKECESLTPQSSPVTADVKWVNPGQPAGVKATAAEGEETTDAAREENEAATSAVPAPTAAKIAPTGYVGTSAPTVLEAEAAAE